MMIKREGETPSKGASAKAKGTDIPVIVVRAVSADITCCTSCNRKHVWIFRFGT
jgi:hypothetical protein